MIMLEPYFATTKLPSLWLYKHTDRNTGFPNLSTHTCTAQNKSAASAPVKLQLQHQSRVRLHI